MVLATQNPLEYQGTFPLPEAQLDRFIMKISLGYPDKKHEIEILKNSQNNRNISEIEPVATKIDIQKMQQDVENIVVHDDILDYIVQIANATRNDENLTLGVSPRASIDLLKVAKAKAYLYGREYVIPDDVKEMVVPVLIHRLILSSGARMENISIEEILERVLKRVTVPVRINE